MKNRKVTTLFCDVGGVLLSNGWGHQSRMKAAELFGFDFQQYEARHQLVFDDYEKGLMTLEEYLRLTVFFQPCSFSYENFIEFMYSQSTPYPRMIEYIHKIRQEYNLKVVLLSNEGRELVDYRMHKFGLKTFADLFIFSCFLGRRKPDKKIFQIALDVAQVKPEDVVFLDDRDFFVDIARQMGIHAIHHTDEALTKSALRDCILTQVVSR